MRLIRQLLTEALALSVAGVLSGLCAAWALYRAMVSLYPGTLPRIAEGGATGAVLLFAVILATLSAAFFGVDSGVWVIWPVNALVDVVVFSSPVVAALKNVATKSLISAQLSVFRISPFNPAEPSVSCQVPVVSLRSMSRATPWRGNSAPFMRSVVRQTKIQLLSLAIRSRDGSTWALP